MYSGLWMFAWDLADEGIDKVMGWAADAGITALQVAGSYHAGWFIHPHNPKCRAFMTEDGSVYFQPNLALYSRTPLKPRVASVCAKTDWMREAGRRLDRHGLKLVSWTVCCHNTRLGLLHPECTVRNCFGDSYPHALCPANEHGRAYLCALCRDLANSLPLHAVQLESPEYMGLRHGHHHERDLTVLSPVETQLMDLCFCEACIRAAEGKHVDIRRVRAAVRAVLEAGMAAAPGRPAGHPQSMAEAEAHLPELTAMRAFRREIEETLVVEIKAAMRPSGALLYLLGRPSLGNAGAVDVYNSGVYGQKPAQVLASTRAAKQDLSARHQLYMGVRLGLDSVADQAELAEIVAAVKQGGAEGVMFYNYSESPMTTLDWIKPALAAAR
ncbi:MAG TPA: hypothetical protein VKT77_02390 [Chthonomonadaceae bacterium]|nr:hypothetical protein [Chthonomonadaceae bacterium]